MFTYIVFILSLVGVVIYFGITKFNEYRVANMKDASKETAQKFVNVKDILGKALYTNDEKIFTYIKVQPVSIDLLSKNEKEQFTRTLTGELSGDNQPFKFIAVSRPVDISPLLNDYQEKFLSSTDPIQKKLLKNEMVQMNHFALSGEVVERQFYFVLWCKNEDQYSERDLLKRANDFVEHLESVQIKAHVIEEKEIFRLLNLINNPAYSNVDDDNYEQSIPILQM